MVVAPSFARESAAMLAALNSAGPRAAIGLHVTLTGPLRPKTADYTPAVDGAFLPLGATLRLAMQQRLDMSALTREIEAQFAAFRAAFGRPPDYVDGHQHVHLFPQVRHAVLDATRRLSPEAWVRQCGSSLPLHRRLTDPKGLLIDWLSREFRARADRFGIATNPAFAGTYTYRANADFEQIFPTFLDGMPEGGLIMCHTGFVDAELERLDPLTTLREREYAYFCSERFAETLKAHDLTLN
jgi:predicted glycoside hydrolase/deacetylase ChbG (UPF0249 family)